MRLVRFALPALAAAVVVAALAPLVARAAAPPDFDTLVSALEHHYSAHVQRVPLMGFVSFCAWVTTGGGVHGMKVADFEHFSGPSDPAELERFVSDTLGPRWEHFVTNRSRDGELNLIYVQPHGSAMRMMIADYEHGELDLVRMDLNGERLAHWVQDPTGSARGHAGHPNQSQTPD